DLCTSAQEAATESQAAPTVAAEEAVLTEAPEVGGANLEAQQSHSTTPAERAQAKVDTENLERTEVEQPPQQATQNQQQSAESTKPSVGQGEQEGVEQPLMEVASARHLETAEQSETSAQPEAASSEKENPEDTDLNTREDNAEEEVNEDESEEAPNFT